MDFGVKAPFKSGDQYHNLTLTGKSFFKNSKRHVEAICSCGNIKFVCFPHVLKGAIKSCGCLKNVKDGFYTLFPITKGDNYSFLTLTGHDKFVGNKRYVEAICNPCGKVWFTELRGVLKGGTKSCGCKRLEMAHAGAYKHGMSGRTTHPIYRAWRAMQVRCRGDREQDFKNYTARGITVCNEWVEDFLKFRDWAFENGWQEGLSLDRRDNDGGYSPSNCRWATDAVQTRNTRKNHFITAFGETKCIVDWTQDERCLVSSAATLKYRIRKLKWTPEKAIVTRNRNLVENRIGDKRDNSCIVNYKSESKPLAQWCNLYNLPYKVIWCRIFSRGWTIERALEKPTKKVAK